ncbi:MAG: DUF1365 family protein [Enterobacterales bacterium]|jgi:DUF1365 family protein
MHSKIYFGRIQHKRFLPKLHQFNYKLFMLYIDLDELPSLFKRFWFWSKDKKNIACFLSKDYIGGTEVGIKSAVYDAVEKKYHVRPQGPVRMLTHLRYFGHCFNPVTFYYCFDEKSEKVNFIVAEIENTPWGQRFSYVLDNRQNKTSLVQSSFDKEFHVSPFLPMDMQCHWRFSSPEKKLSVMMQNFKEQEKVFHACLVLKAHTINSRNLAKALVLHPLMSWKVSLGIYWQALRLWLKRIPFISNPHLTEQ